MKRKINQPTNTSCLNQQLSTRCCSCRFFIFLSLFTIFIAIIALDTPPPSPPPPLRSAFIFFFHSITFAPNVVRVAIVGRLRHRPMIDLNGCGVGERRCRVPLLWRWWLTNLSIVKSRKTTTKRATHPAFVRTSHSAQLRLLKFQMAWIMQTAKRSLSLSLSLSLTHWLTHTLQGNRLQQSSGPSPSLSLSLPSLSLSLNGSRPLEEEWEMSDHTRRMSEKRMMDLFGRVLWKRFLPKRRSRRGYKKMRRLPTWGDLL